MYKVLLEKFNNMSIDNAYECALDLVLELNKIELLKAKELNDESLSVNSGGKAVKIGFEIFEKYLDYCDKENIEKFYQLIASLISIEFSNEDIQKVLNDSDL